MNRNLKAAMILALCAAVAGCSSAESEAGPGEPPADHVESASDSDQPTADSEQSTADSGESEANATVNHVVTETEQSMFGTWELVAMDEPGLRGRLGYDLGDVCTFGTDMSLQCTFEGVEVAGYWFGIDAVKVGDQEMPALLDCAIDTEGYGGSQTFIDIEGTAATLGGSFKPETWNLISPAAEKPVEVPIIDMSAQLVGSWTLISIDEEENLANYVEVGDTCVFSDEHTFSCDGERSEDGLWQAIPTWPEASMSLGNSLRVALADGGGTGGAYEITGDKMTWWGGRSEWERSG